VATVTTKGGAITFVLELDEAEAQYVLEALRNTHPAKLGGSDPVWDALDDTMREAGVPRDDDALA
jgi:hypothetical protein